MRLGAASLLALVLATGGCGVLGAGDAEGHSFTLPTSDVEVPLHGVSWMHGSVLHVDGRTVDTGVAASQYALLPDGVLLVKGLTLWFCDTRHPATRVARIAGSTSMLAVAPDGHHVAFMDAGYGEQDGRGDRVYRMNVLDTRTGRQVATSSKGLGDPHGDVGLAEQYEEYDPQVEAVDDHAAYAEGPESRYWAYPFDGSAPHRVAGSAVPRYEQGGRSVFVTPTKQGWRQDPDGTLSGSISPTGEVGLADVLNVRFHPFDPRTGRRIELEVPAGTNRFALGGWFPDGDFWGFAFHGRYADITGTGRMVRCAAAARRCTPVSEPVTSRSKQPLVLDGQS